jgi:hypothetical protein
MGYIYEKMSWRGQEAIEITGYEGSLSDMTIPDAVQGLPVRSIAAHAFSDRDELRSVHLGRNVKVLRPFSFYNCKGLQSMELYNTTDDYYDGVIRQCPALEEITVHVTEEENYIILRSMLQDVDGMLSFHLMYGDDSSKELYLTFPEYVNEAREDTMARAIHFSIEGAGMAYRECVGKRQLDLSGYDRLLERLTRDDDAAAAKIALGRLLYPSGLSEGARKEYEDFLRDNSGRIVELLIQKDADRSQTAPLRLMTDRNLIDRAALEKGMILAAKKGRIELGGILMEHRSRQQENTAFPGLQLEW